MKILYFVVVMAGWAGSLYMVADNFKDQAALAIACLAMAGIFWKLGTVLLNSIAAEVKE